MRLIVETDSAMSLAVNKICKTFRFSFPMKLQFHLLEKIPTATGRSSEEIFLTVFSIRISECFSTEKSCTVMMNCSSNLTLVLCLLWTKGCDLSLITYI